MLQKIFDWFDEAASRVLRLAYLVPFVIATAVYFGGRLPWFLQDFMTGALPWVLGFAVETQDYISVRKMAVIWHALKAPALEDHQRKQLRIEMWVQILIVAALSGFSIWNQASYLSENWHPTTSAFGAPRWLDIAIRSVGPALFFFLTAFAAPMAKSLGEKLGDEAHKTLEAFLGVVTKQRKKAIEKIDTDIVDMRGAIVEVADAAREGKVGAVLAQVQGAIVALAGGKAGPVPAPKAKSPASSTARSRTTVTVEDTRRVWREGMTPSELASATGISYKTAQRRVKQFKTELAGTKPYTVTRLRRDNLN